MASEILTTLEQHVRCPVCHDMVKNAKILSCGHTYCEECLTAVIPRRAMTSSVSVQCPYCRRTVSIKGSAKNLTSNVLVNNITDALASLGKRSSEYKCPVHPVNEKKYYCERCAVMVCSECALDDHIDHGGCPKRIEEMAKIFQVELNKLLDQSNVWVENHIAYQSYVEHIQAGGLTALDDVEKLVLQSYEDRLSELSESKKRMSDYISEQRRSFSAHVKEVVSADNAITDRVVKARDRANRIRQKGTAAEIVDSYAEFVKQFQKDLAIEVPSAQNTETELDAVKALFFERVNPPKYNIGRIRRRLGKEDVQSEWDVNSQSEKISRATQTMQSLMTDEPQSRRRLRWRYTCISRYAHSTSNRIGAMSLCGEARNRSKGNDVGEPKQFLKSIHNTSKVQNASTTTIQREKSSSSHGVQFDEERVSTTHEERREQRYFTIGYALPVRKGYQGRNRVRRR